MKLMSNKPRIVRLILFVLVIISLIAPWDAPDWNNGLYVSGARSVLLIIASSYFLCLPPYAALFILWILAIQPDPHKIIIWCFRATLIFWLIVEFFIDGLQSSLLWGYWLYLSSLVLSIVFEVIIIILELVKKPSAQ